MIIVLSTTQKMKFSIKDFFSKFDQILRKLRIWSHLLKKSLMENFNFLQCSVKNAFDNILQEKAQKNWWTTLTGTLLDWKCIQFSDPL